MGHYFLDTQYEERERKGKKKIKKKGRTERAKHKQKRWKWKEKIAVDKYEKNVTFKVRKISDWVSQCIQLLWGIAQKIQGGGIGAPIF